MPDTRELRKTDDLPLRAQRFLYDRKHLSDEDKGALFIGFSSRQGIRYLHEMEWRLPKYNIL